MILVLIKQEEELQPNFKVVDNVISDKHVKSFNKDEYKAEKLNLG